MGITLHPHPSSAKRGEGGAKRRVGDATIEYPHPRPSGGPSPRRGRDEGGNSLPAHGTLYTEHDAEPTIWQVPEEVPVAIQFNSAAYAVMMATPADFDDFAIGFALAEGLVARASDIRGVLTLPSEQGFAIDISVHVSKLDPARMVK